MTNTKHKIIVAVTGASGSIYAKVLFDKLQKYMLNAAKSKNILPAN